MKSKWKKRNLMGMALSAATALSLVVPAAAADYSFTTDAPRDYYGATSYEDVYGSRYNYGGPNVTDYQAPELEYGNPSTTQTGAMEQATLPGIQGSTDSEGSAGGYGIGSGGPDTLVMSGTQNSHISYEQVKYTSVSGMTRSDGSIGTVKIPSLGISMKVWEGETTASMKKGLGHYSSTSGWDGNVGLCGHNRGAKYVIGSIKDLKAGDRIIYTTVYGTRTYQVSFVRTIADTDWSYLQSTADNRITITTCLANQPSVRICVQAVEKK